VEDLVVERGVGTQHDLGDRTAQVLATAAAVALDYRRLARGTGHDQVAGQVGGRLMAHRTQRQQLYRSLHDSAGGQPKKRAVAKQRGVEGGKGVV
jgi:hypothetical protein